MLAAAGACSTISPPQGKSPLARAPMSPDSCVLDIFFVRLPSGDKEANGPMWAEIDEQHLPCELRRRLAQDGFRVGLVGGQMPPKLIEVLELDNKPVPSGDCIQVNLEDLESAPRVVRRHLQIRAGRTRQIVTSGVSKELPVLLSTADGVCGRSYPEAQGVLSVKALPEPDGRVRLELVPELHYGEYGPRFAGHQHAFRIETTRPHRVFDELAFSAMLTAGDMVVVTSLPNRLGSLGHRFFSQEYSGRDEQKLLVIRLSQTQHEDLYSPKGVLPPEEDAESPILLD
ncbi:MAG: hypothetical protein A2V98_15105 [Planctomycetes bacterium RBG_16_64_12]|nr:MAG: hypothetical protein A2V98_15105 [Planctomycetes bacterium RBG_16_64_12]